MTQEAPQSYPVDLRGSLDEPLNRWLFLVKWLLIIPHVLVVVFLLIFLVVSIAVAFFAILFTGKYPRGLFDFNVGVLRWGWRLGFYSYDALGTDRYPPFSLQTQDYPADLTVEYPQRLSRKLVLVKWLLAIPHLLVVGIFQGWGSRYIGLIGVLVLIAAVANLFTGRYPQGIFDLVLGMNRWSYRVYAYVALMTDRYPPFRLGPIALLRSASPRSASQPNGLLPAG